MVTPLKQKRDLSATLRWIAERLVIALLAAGITGGAIFAKLFEALEANNNTMASTSSLVFTMEPGPDVPFLKDILDGTSSEEEALDRLVQYYDENRDRLRQEWRIEDETSLRATYAMYIVHISVPYGVTEQHDSILEFAYQERAHCGTYSDAQRLLSTALGLTWRWIAFENGDHGWIEVQVDGQWQIFDSTTNVWVDQPMEALVKGNPRHYRVFYSPMEDERYPEYRLHLAEGWNMVRLRNNMPCMGLCSAAGAGLVTQATSED